MKIERAQTNMPYQPDIKFFHAIQKDIESLVKFNLRVAKESTQKLLDPAIVRYPVSKVLK